MSFIGQLSVWLVHVPLEYKEIWFEKKIYSDHTLTGTYIFTDTELQIAADENLPLSSESFDQSAEENLDHTNNDLGISRDLYLISFKCNTH